MLGARRRNPAGQQRWRKPHVERPVDVGATGERQDRGVGQVPGEGRNGLGETRILGQTGAADDRDDRTLIELARASANSPSPARAAATSPDRVPAGSERVGGDVIETGAAGVHRR